MFSASSGCGHRVSYRSMSSLPIDLARDSLSGRPAADILDEMAAAISASKSFVIATHVGPDGDALGSAVALALGLRSLGKEARAVTAQQIPKRYEPLMPPGVMSQVNPDEFAAKLAPTDWFVALDTSEPSRIGDFEPLFFAPGARRICIDHHRTQEVGRYDHELVVPEAPATGSLVLALLDRLEIELDDTMAQALWIAIATDTGWFRFSNTGPWALADAARLSAHRLDVESLHDQIYHDLSPERARVLGVSLSNVRVERDGDFIWSVIRLNERAGLDLAELDGMIDQLKSIRGARIFALVVETEPNSFKVSLRATGDAEVESIAREFGGGGHAKAAGCRFTGALPDLIDKLNRCLEAL